MKQIMIPLILAGIILFIPSLFEVSLFFRLNMYGIRTVGVVDSIYTYEGKMYVIQFKASNGDSVKIENYFHTDDDRYQVGEKVEVCYLENDVQNSRIDSFKERYLPFIMTFTIGCIFCGLGIFGLWKDRK